MMPQGCHARTTGRKRFARHRLLRMTFVCALAFVPAGCMIFRSPAASSESVAGWGKDQASQASVKVAEDPATRIDKDAKRTSLQENQAAAEPAPAASSSPPPIPAVNEAGRPEAAGAASRTPLGSMPAETVPAVAANISAAAIPVPESEFPIDLSSALRLAERQNPIIGEARARIGEALARLQRARVELLPMLNAGVDYSAHTGVLQRSAGTIIGISRQMLYFGGGTGTTAQGTIETPAVSIVESLADALYDPLVAHQRLHQARFDASATANSILLEVTRYYLELLGATARLQADRQSAKEAEELMRITERFARTGEGRPADFHRAQTEWRIRRGEARRSEEAVAVAAARLSRRLHMDPSIRIHPNANVLEILALVDLNSELESLVQTALRESTRDQVGRFRSRRERGPAQASDRSTVFANACSRR